MLTLNRLDHRRMLKDYWESIADATTMGNLDDRRSRRHVKDGGKIKRSSSDK